MHVSRTRTSATLLVAALLMLAPALHPQEPAGTAPPQQTSAGSTPSADVTPGAIHTAPRSEPPVDGLIRKDPDTLALTLSKDRTLILRDFDFNGEPVDTSKIHLRQLSPGVYELSSLAWTVGYWHFTLADDAAYYGLGEHFDTLDHAHTIVHNLSMDNAGTKGSSTYKPIPFYMSTTGYGLWLDTTGDATFDFNATDRQQIAVDATTNRLRILLFTGPKEHPGRFPYLLADFTQLTGRALLPPYWAFAPWQARDFHQTQAQVTEDIDETRVLGLPASVILIDSPWETAYNSYLPNPKQFDDWPAMVKHLHESGYKLVLWHTPWINNKSDKPGEPGFEGKIDEVSPNYAVAEERGFFVKEQNNQPYVGRWWKGQGSLIDFTNPKARQWWQDQLRQAISAGADGFKDDDAEGTFLGADVKFYDGTDARLMRNRYGTLYNNTVEELIQNDLKGNGVLFARSVTTGANGLGFLWAGDNDASFSPLNGLPTVVTAGISAGLSGMPLWAADLGGYRRQPDTPNPTLLARWTEFAAFTPVMEVMSQANLTPWTFDSTSGGSTALDIYRKYAILHTSLFPYLYQAAQESANTGQPILRALVLNYQDDARARTTKDEYLLGSDLLVAPILDENTSRVVYIPSGDWLNLFTGEAVSGPRAVIAKAPLDTIPVFARRGTVLPRIPEDVMTLVSPADSGNKSVHALDNRRLFEILGPAATTETSFTDFEGRTVTRSGDTLLISEPTGTPDPQSGATPIQGTTRVILRWRFMTPHSVTLNGASLPIRSDPSGNATVEFDQTSASTIAWQ